MTTRDLTETERSEASAPAATLLPILARCCPLAQWYFVGHQPKQSVRFLTLVVQKRLDFM
jgi:hypothetical protein